MHGSVGHGLVGLHGGFQNTKKVNRYSDTGIDVGIGIIGSDISGRSSGRSSRTDITQWQNSYCNIGLVQRTLYCSIHSYSCKAGAQTHNTQKTEHNYVMHDVSLCELPYGW